MNRKLVAYFSASGVTAGVAKTLAAACGAELYEIKPETPYTTADLDWNDRQSRSTVEMEDTLFRPALADVGAGIANYGTVFVGFPIWWYIAPTIVNTFLESYDFSNKVIVPFATSGGSGLGESEVHLHASCPAAVWRPGRVLRGNITEEAARAWVDSLALDAAGD